MPTIPAPTAATLRQHATASLSSLRALPASVTSVALSLPDTYSKYVAANVSAVSQIESGLRSLTYLLPGARLHDSEVASESLHTFVQLLSIYHDHLLKGRANLLSASPALEKMAVITKPKPTPHMRYTNFWSVNSTLYTRIATVLKVVQYTELLWEMVARRKGGEKTRWRVVVLLESFKALCKLLLMRLTGSRPLVSPPLPLREEFAPEEPASDTDETLTDEELTQLDPMPMDETDHDMTAQIRNDGILTPPISEPDSSKPSPNLKSTTTPYPMPRTGTYLPTLPLPTNSSISSYLLSHVITPDDVKPAYALLQRLSTIGAIAGETLHIIRPLIYVLLLQRSAATYGYTGRKWRRDWTPWIIGLSIDYAARQLAKQARSGGRVSALEQEELRKRTWGMGWWGMRGAFYENVTRGMIEGVRERVKGKVPIVGELVGGVLEDYEYLWGEYYFSTA